MKYQNQTSLTTLTIGLVLFFLLGLTQPLFAEMRGSRQGNIRGSSPDTQSWTQPSGGKVSQGKDRSGITPRIVRDNRQIRDRNTYRQRDWYREQYRGWDTRYHHNRYYPARGHYVRTLPRGYHTVYHYHTPYYFWDGIWYRPYGSYFTVIAPPIGLVIPLLPPFYTTLWVGGIPYYYANDTYYTYYPGGGYVVTDPPKDQVSEAPPEADWLYSYPTRGQSEQQQADDRYACHRWAVDQTGYDPTQPLGGVPESQSAQKRNDYQRALGACLEGRGYNVK